MLKLRWQAVLGGLMLMMAVAGAPRPAEATLTVVEDDLQCLALTMYWEAKGEGEGGMLATAFVIRNRVKHPGFPKTVCQVVYQGGQEARCQFSFWCDGRSTTPVEWSNWRKAKRLAADFLAGRHRSDPTGGAIFFHADYIDIPWAMERKRTVQIGRHIFYR